jgi:hypothetical protein
MGIRLLLIINCGRDSGGKKDSILKSVESYVAGALSGLPE